MDVFDIDLLSTPAAVTLVLLALVPAAIAVVALRLTKHPKPGRWALALGALTLPVFALIVWQLLSAQVRLDDDALAVDGGLYGVSVPYAQIDVDRIVVGDASAMPRLLKRTNGIGLPGSLLGWFRTADRRVFAAYTGGAGSVLIPTRGDFDVVVTPADAQRLVDALSRRAAAASR